MLCCPLFSPEDYDLASLSWNLKDGYARRTLNIGKRPNRKAKTLFAHVIVANRMFGKRPPGKLVDHKNSNRLDDQRDNIRLVSHTQNSQHRVETEFRGTTLHRCGKWQVQIGHQGRTIYVGLFSSRSEAAKAASAKRDELGFLRGAL